MLVPPSCWGRAEGRKPESDARRSQRFGCEPPSRRRIWSAAPVSPRRPRPDTGINAPVSPHANQRQSPLQFDCLITTRLFDHYTPVSPHANQRPPAGAPAPLPLARRRVDDRDTAARVRACPAENAPCARVRARYLGTWVAVHVPRPDGCCKRTLSCMRAAGTHPDKPGGTGWASVGRVGPCRVIQSRARWAGSECMMDGA